MANKRTLKKNIKYACGDLAAETIMSEYYVPDIDAAKVRDIVLGVASLQQSTLRRVSVSFDKTPGNFDNRHEYNKARNKYMRQAFAHLKSDFGNALCDSVKLMNTLLTDDVKAANVEALKK